MRATAGATPFTNHHGTEGSRPRDNAKSAATSRCVAAKFRIHECVALATAHEASEAPSHLHRCEAPTIPDSFASLRRVVLDELLNSCRSALIVVCARLSENPRKCRAVVSCAGRHLGWLAIGRRSAQSDRRAESIHAMRGLTNSCCGVCPHSRVCFLNPSTANPLLLPAGTMTPARARRRNCNERDGGDKPNPSKADSVTPIAHQGARDNGQFNN